MRSRTCRMPLGPTCTVTAACGSVNAFSAAAGAASASAPSAAASEMRALLRCGSIRLEADRRRLAIAGVLQLEELSPREAEHAGEKHGGKDLHRVVVRQHGVVVDLA